MAVGSSPQVMILGLYEPSSGTRRLRVPSQSDLFETAFCSEAGQKGKSLKMQVLNKASVLLSSSAAWRTGVRPVENGGTAWTNKCLHESAMNADLYLRACKCSIRRSTIFGRPPSIPNLQARHICKLLSA